MGDEKAFREIFYAYVDRLCAWADKITGNHTVAEDIVQSFFVRLWENRQSVSFMNASAFRAYAFKAVYNASLNCMRDNGRLVQEHDTLSDMAAEETEADMLEEKISLLEDAFNRLPERCRQIFLMAKIEGKSYSEIAEELGLSENTVKVQVSKAYHILRKNDITS